VFPLAYDMPDGVEWEGGPDTCETRIRITEGYGHSDGGCATHREYHICPDCFKTKLEPWLIGQDAKPTLTESN